MNEFLIWDLFNTLLDLNLLSNRLIDEVDSDVIDEEENTIFYGNVDEEEDIISYGDIDEEEKIVATDEDEKTAPTDEERKITGMSRLLLLMKRRRLLVCLRRRLLLTMKMRILLICLRIRLLLLMKRRILFDMFEEKTSPTNEEDKMISSNDMSDEKKDPKGGVAKYWGRFC